MMHADLRSTYTKRTILVTGASGYIATNVINALQDVDCQIIRFSRKKLVPVLSASAKIQDIQGDLESIHNWSSILSDVDFIFHFAAQTGVAVADSNPLKDIEINVMGTLALMNAAKQYKNISFVFASAATVYGAPKSIPVSEKTPNNPSTLYDLNKLTIENYLAYFSKKNWLSSVSLRLANVYGPGVKSSNQSRGVLNQVIKNALDGKNPVAFCGGEFLRDYIYIDDVVSAFLMAGANMNALNGACFVIGTGVGTTLKDTFQLVISLVNENFKTSLALSNYEPPNGLPSIDKRDFVSDSKAFSITSGWKPKYTLKQGIQLTIEDYQRSRSKCATP